jgi:hypothetical protein
MLKTEGLLASVRRSGRIDAADVLAARRAVYGEDGAIAKDELEAVFAIDEAANSVCDDWVAFFAEAVTDHLVHQVSPHGYIDEANADWLMARIDRDGMVKSASELEVLVKCLEAATSAPSKLSAYALQQVRHAVLEGEGPLVRGQRLDKMRVNAADVAMLRRILYAFGSAGNAAITRAEADVLFEINEKTAGLDNDADWPDLFIKAIANFMMAASGYRAPTREVALRREKWLDEPTGGVTGFFARMFSGDLKWLADAFRNESAIDTANQERETMIAENVIVTDEEAHWLAERIGKDGTVSANERALLTFIKSESITLHPKLQRLVDRSAA